MNEIQNLETSKNVRQSKKGLVAKLLEKGETQETTENQAEANPEKESVQDSENIRKRGIFDKITEMFKKSEAQSQE